MWNEATINLATASGWKDYMMKTSVEKDFFATCALEGWRPPPKHAGRKFHGAIPLVYIVVSASALSYAGLRV